MSYLKPRRWWLRPLAWTGKCQSLDIPQQWAAGVRYFDIRIRFRGDKVISGHGCSDYNVNVYDWIEYLDSLSDVRKEPCVIRMMLEESGTKYDEQFKAFVQMCRQKNAHLTFVGGLRKSPFEVIAEVDSAAERHCYQHFQDYGAKTVWQKLKGLKFPWPWYYARKNNAKYREGLNDSAYTILDFVELK